MSIIVKDLVRIVSSLTGVPIDLIMSPRRDAITSQARFAVYHRARERGLSLPVIGRALGRDHTTVLDGARRAVDLERRDRRFGTLMQDVRYLDVQQRETLYISLLAEYFDQIRDGTKVEEFRLATGYWAKRLLGMEYKRIVLTRGYPRGGGVEGETRLTRAWRGFRMRTITHEHFGPKPVEVFAIDVSEPAA